MKLIPIITLLSIVAPAALAQVCDQKVVQTTPSKDFVLNDNGTVTHKKTGLVWMRCAVGSIFDGSTCIGSGNTYNWEEAFDVADSTTYANESDWRLPTIDELTSIVEAQCTAPSVNQAVFPHAPMEYLWSASRSPISDTGALQLNSSLGLAVNGARINPHNVRLVHD